MKNYDWNHLLNTYKKIVKPSFVVLEIGASTKERTNDLVPFCKKIIGIEYNKKRLLKNSKNIEYLLGDWQKLSKILKPNSIDLAISSHVIEHVSDDIKALNELYSVLKPNSCAIINTPNRERLTRKIIEVFTGKRKFPYWEHVREYTESDLVSLISKSKFKKYKITALVFGIHGANVNFYLKKAPKFLRKLSNFWEIVLYK